MIRLFVNVYKDADPAREAELGEAWARNMARFEAVAPIEGRPTFDEIFALANQIAGPDDVCIVANSDICFDGPLPEPAAGEAFALTRWDETERQGVAHYAIFSDEHGVPRIDSQDAWAWRGKCRVTGANFTPGVRGCDNHLTYLFHKAGYKVSNPSLSIIATHLHRSEVRRYGHEPDDCVPKPYLLIAPHRLGDTPRLDLRF